jgi:hypothetical protein
MLRHPGIQFVEVLLAQGLFKFDCRLIVREADHRFIRRPHLGGEFPSYDGGWIEVGDGRGSDVVCGGETAPAKHKTIDSELTLANIETP